MTVTLDQAIWLFRDQHPANGYWHTEAGPALLAACHHATRPYRERESSMPAYAVGTMSRLIREHPFASQTDKLPFTFFALELGLAQLILRPTQNLAPQVDKLWTDTLTEIATDMVRRGELRWYANGNIGLVNAAVMALAWRVTGDGKFLGHFREALEFVESPTQPRWAGMGLVRDPAWTKTDGSDQAGHFVETGPFGSGLDTGYTGLQADFLGVMALVTDDWTVWRLLRTVWGRLASLIDAQCTIDMTAGTRRHDQPGTRWPFEGSALPIMAAAGDARAQAVLAPWWAHMESPARYTPANLGSGAWYGMGLGLGVGMLARSGWRP